MKSVGQLSPTSSPDSVKVSKQESTAKPAEQSPYLKAVLAEKGTTGTARVLSISSMAAALRYIANSSKPAMPGKLITPAW